MVVRFAMDQALSGDFALSSYGFTPSGNTSSGLGYITNLLRSLIVAQPFGYLIKNQTNTGISSKLPMCH